MATEEKKGRAPRFYPADDIPKPIKRNFVLKPTKLRPSITPGTVLIILAGQFKGKRVVFLKQLESGLLLVDGPYSLNGVPLRRVNQRYVIATSTKVNIDGVDVSGIDDKYFAKDKKKTKKGESEFFEGEEDQKKSKVSEEKKQTQKEFDSKLLEIIQGVPQLSSYLKTRFSLKSGEKPHELKF